MAVLTAALENGRYVSAERDLVRRTLLSLDHLWKRESEDGGGKRSRSRKVVQPDLHGMRHFLHLRRTDDENSASQYIATQNYGGCGKGVKASNGLRQSEACPPMGEHLPSFFLFGVSYALLLETARTGCGTRGLGSGRVIRDVLPDDARAPHKPRGAR
jgi:hypothetical protein